MADGQSDARSEFGAELQQKAQREAQREAQRKAQAAFFDGVAMPGSDMEANYLPPPSALLALTEGQRLAFEVLSLAAVRRLLASQPRGDGHPVMVLPGFLGSDGYNNSLRRFLASLGYAAHGWGLGRNLGPRDGTLERLLDRFDFLYRRHRQPLTLIGHSLGGIFARELAREMPEKVRQVISLGSPFGKGRRTASYPSRLFAALNPEEEMTVDEAALHIAPPVPTSAIYSKGDGIVNWQTAVQQRDLAYGPVENIQIRGSHCGMTLNPTVWYLLADRLRQTRENWQPFDASSLSKLLVPSQH